jgi:hypothetical protein
LVAAIPPLSSGCFFSGFASGFASGFVLDLRRANVAGTLAHRKRSAELQTSSDQKAADPLVRFRDRLSLPLVAAPMFRVSGIELVVAACRNGVIGAFPTVNCRSPEELDSWLGEIERRLRLHSETSERPPAPVCPNLTGGKADRPHLIGSQYPQVQSRRYNPPPATSVYRRSTDILNVRRCVPKVPFAEVAGYHVYSFLVRALKRSISMEY